MTTPQEAQQFVGRTALDADGSKVGKIGQVYLDKELGQPLWVTVATGMFGTRQSFAPIYGSRVVGGQVVLAVSKDQIKDAPNIDDDRPISPSEQDALYQHYRSQLGAGQTGYAQSGQPDRGQYAESGRPGMPAENWPVTPPARPLTMR